MEDKIDLDDLTQVRAEFRRQIKQLRAQLDGIIADPDIKYLKTALPRPQPRDIAVMQGDIVGGKSAARAVPGGTAHAGLKEEVDPRQRQAARPDPLVGVGGAWRCCNRLCNSTGQSTTAEKGGRWSESLCRKQGDLLTKKNWCCSFFCWCLSLVGDRPAAARMAAYTRTSHDQLKSQSKQSHDTRCFLRYHYPI